MITLDVCITAKEDFKANGNDSLLNVKIKCRFKVFFKFVFEENKSFSSACLCKFAVDDCCSCYTVIKKINIELLCTFFICQ